MGVLGTVAQAAQLYPALIPLAAGAIGLALWAYRRKQFGLSLVALTLGGLFALLYTGGAPALALNGPGPAPTVEATAVTAPSGISAGRGALTTATLPADYDRARFSSTTRLHPRFPKDLPLPGVFRLETNSGGTRSGQVTARFRFRGEGAEAVADFKELAESSGWQVEVLAPHRLTLRKNDQVVQAWFSYPGHSVVLDIPDAR
jgi:hypothetical protein